MPRSGASFPAHFDQADLHWAAGLFEGEGCILGRSDGSLTITMRQTDLDVISRFHQIMGGNLYGPYPSREAHHKLHYEWAARGRGYFLAFAETFGPLLGVRRQAKLTELCGWTELREAV